VILAKVQRTQRLFGLKNKDFEVLGDLGAFARLRFKFFSPRRKERKGNMGLKN